MNEADDRTGRAGACRAAHEELVLLHYGELDPAARAELERHLAACVECRAEERALRSALDLLGRWDVPDPGESARAAARRAAAAARESPLRQRVGRLPRLALPLASAAALCALLAAFGARARYAQGELTLSLSAPWAAAAPAQAPAPLDVALREDQRALERRVARLERSVDGALLAQEDVLLHVQDAQAQFAEADRALSRVVGAVARDSALENRRTRDALLQLASVVSVEEPR